MVAKIHKELNRVVTLEEIFRAPTIEGIASLIGILEWAGKHTVENHQNQSREEILL